MISKLLKVARNPSLFVPAAQRRFREIRLSRKLFRSMFANENEIRIMEAELKASGLVAELDDQIKQFYSLKDLTTGGKAAGPGVMSSDEGTALYLLVRKLAPETVVETGVCSGYSSALILKAMQLNNKGKLHSIDYPEVLGKSYESGDFWEGKGGAVIPPGEESGWLIPDYLKDRWVLQLGKTQELLEPLLKELVSIDMFIHDSEHSYECMTFEYNAAWKVLRHRGLLVSDDIGWNTAFFDFAARVGEKSGKVASNMGFLVKNR